MKTKLTGCSMGRLQPASTDNGLSGDSFATLYGFLIFKYSHALIVSIEMEKFYQELFDVLIRCRSVSIRKRESKAASLATSGINKAQIFHNFIMGKH